MIGLFDYEKLHMQAHALSENYNQVSPFPHAVIDDVANQHSMWEAKDTFPTKQQLKWFKYDNVFEKKLATNQNLPAIHREILLECNSAEFLQFLEILTGIKGLMADPKFYGGGLHCIERGGKLDIHADYNYHAETKFDRRLNVIIYLNYAWQEQWGGHLELWDKEMTRPVSRILPLFNRMVVFNTTDTSYHGHPEPVECPEYLSRKSIALYYYTNSRPESERSEPHSTLYKKRPQDETSEQLEALRERRSHGRIEDSTT